MIEYRFGVDRYLSFVYLAAQNRSFCYVCSYNCLLEVCGFSVSSLRFCNLLPNLEKGFVIYKVLIFSRGLLAQNQLMDHSHCDSYA